MASATSQYSFYISIILTAASAITNPQEPPPHYSTIQYQGFNNQGGVGSLTPQEQILSDVQQHRFYVPQRQRVQSQVPPFEPPRPEYQGFHPQNHFPFHNYQPNYQPERPKPILLQPTFPEEFKPQSRPSVQPSYQPQLNYQSQNGFQQSFQQPKESGRFQQNQQTFNDAKQINPTYHQGFQGLDNFVVPEKTQKHQQYLTETVIPKQPVYSATSKPEIRSETPSWILETQPVTAYKKQKPYDAITFATEAYNPSTPAPRIVKLRQRPTQDTTDIFIKTDRKKLYDQLIKSDDVDTAATRQTTPKPVRSTTILTSTKPTTSEPDEKYIQEQLQKQIQAQLGGKDDIFQTLKITLPGDLSPEQIANLPNIALGDSVSQLPEYSGGISGIPGLPSSKDGVLPESVYLANGQKLKISSLSAKTPKNKNVKTVLIQPTTTTTTPKPNKVIFDELTKNVLPPGADFEIIKQSQDGALENVGPIQNLPQKKVTFVILEEQPDGSVKVQGVRGSENEPTETKGAEVDSIIERLKKGEIKLPPSTKLSKQTHSVTPSESQTSHSYIKQDSKGVTPKRKPVTSSTVYATSSPSGSSNSHSGPIFLEDFSRTTSKPVEYTSPHYSSPSSSSNANFLPTLFPHHDESNNHIHSSTYNPIYSASSARVPSSTPPSPTPTPDLYSFTPRAQSTAYPDEEYYSNHLSSTSTTPAPIGTNSPVAILGDTLKSSGLYAMARYLRQSGLDMVLNETGPYTLFVPTDKAFRALLVQLGGPDRAEIKFKENPRLLSGLLLHHVIPGAFKLSSLLDEMTGVSLAGTQLRVNTYTTQDNEWNDVKVTTINGAKVVKEKADITVPQGIAHTVDRVMFPLPVGDIVQTLQADREGRFSRFIQLLQETGVSAMLQGTKTYTVFAPTDGVLTDSELKKILQQRAAARTLALRHVAPGTLYSAGMLFYQIKESMSSPNQIQLSKEAGRVKVNNAHVISRNIPATNGVIHAIDNLL